MDWFALTAKTYTIAVEQGITVDSPPPPPGIAAGTRQQPCALSMYWVNTTKTSKNKKVIQPMNHTGIDQFIVKYKLKSHLSEFM